jgi:hypothetical protein
LKKQKELGLNVELEHGNRNSSTNVTQDDEVLTGKIALAHLNEFSDYYTRLQKMETEAMKICIKLKNESKCDKRVSHTFHNKEQKAYHPIFPTP